MGKSGHLQREDNFAQKASRPGGKRELIYLVINAFALLFCVVGLATTNQGLVRGEGQTFKIAFIIAIIMTSFDIMLNLILYCALRGQCGSGSNGCKQCGACCLGVCVNILYLGGSLINFFFLVVPVAVSEDYELNHQYGCADGFGCANIMGVMAVVLFAIRLVLIIAFLILSCCSCSSICKDSESGSFNDDRRSHFRDIATIEQPPPRPHPTVVDQSTEPPPRQAIQPPPRPASRPSRLPVVEQSTQRRPFHETDL